MSLHVVKKILAPGKGSQISHLISGVAAAAPFPKVHLSFVLNSRKCGLKRRKVLNISSKISRSKHNVFVFKV